MMDKYETKVHFLKAAFDLRIVTVFTIIFKQIENKVS